jgi:arsenite/tail-anchored protein-transporting ATPase
MKTQYIFFSGKGGVGKSSMAATTAVHYSNKGLRTLLVSTDPAGNLGDIFEKSISTVATSVGDKLDIIQLDSDKITDEYKRKMLAPLEEILDGAALESVKEQFNGGCTVEIATFDRFTDFLSDLTYDYIVFDTAPTGHTLRLMTLPGEWNDYIAKSEQGSGQTCIGPVSQIQDAKVKYEHAVKVMQDPAQSTIFLVSRPEKTSVYETKRAMHELEKTGIHHFEIIINGVIPESAEQSGIFSSLRKKQLPFIQSLREMNIPVTEVPLQSGEIKGLITLQHFAAIIFDKAKESLAINYTDTDEFTAFTDPLELIKLIERGKDKRIIACTGKGGVGKTVAACALAQQVALKGKTLLLTTDPAAHIGQVLQAEVDHVAKNIYGDLWAANIDQRKAGDEYKARILNDAQEKSYSKELITSLTEELESPCTEEIAIFEKFAEYLVDEQWEYIVIDTAPTGHTLRLLELPFDYQQQISMKAPDGTPATAQSTVISSVISMLKDPEITRFFLIAYPEYTPLHESKRAAGDLKRVGINIAGVLINQVLKASDCEGAFAQTRWKMQQHYLHVAQDLFKQPLFAMPLLALEIEGKKGIDTFRRAIFNLSSES